MFSLKKIQSSIYVVDLPDITHAPGYQTSLKEKYQTFNYQFDFFSLDISI